jgi:hypothetical protein
MGFIWFVYPDSIKMRGSNLFLCVFVLTTTHDAFVVQKVSKIWDERISRADFDRCAHDLSKAFVSLDGCLWGLG